MIYMHFKSFSVGYLVKFIIFLFSRLTQETAKNDDNETADGVSSELQRFELKRKFQQLRQKGYTIIDEQALIDQRFVDFVQELLNVNGTNFESLKLREHIDQCAAETKGTFMIGERESPVDSAASPNSYQSFVCAMSQYLLNKYGKSNYSVDPDSAANLDQAYVSVCWFQKNMFLMGLKCIHFFKVLLQKL